MLSTSPPLCSLTHLSGFAAPTPLARKLREPREAVTNIMASAPLSPHARPSWARRKVILGDPPHQLVQLSGGIRLCAKRRAHHADRRPRPPKRPSRAPNFQGVRASNPRRRFHSSFSLLSLGRDHRSTGNRSFSASSACLSSVFFCLVCRNPERFRAVELSSKDPPRRGPTRQPESRLGFAGQCQASRTPSSTINELSQQASISSTRRGFKSPSLPEAREIPPGHTPPTYPSSSQHLHLTMATEDPTAPTSGPLSWYSPPQTPNPITH